MAAWALASWTPPVFISALPACMISTSSAAMRSIRPARALAEAAGRGLEPAGELVARRPRGSRGDLVACLHGQRDDLEHLRPGLRVVLRADQAVRHVEVCLRLREVRRQRRTRSVRVRRLPHLGASGWAWASRSSWASSSAGARSARRWASARPSAAPSRELPGCSWASWPVWLDCRQPRWPS